MIPEIGAEKFGPERCFIFHFIFIEFIGMTLVNKII